MKEYLLSINIEYKAEALLRFSYCLNKQKKLDVGTLIKEENYIDNLLQNNPNKENLFYFMINIHYEKNIDDSMMKKFALVTDEFYKLHIKLIRYGIPSDIIEYILNDIREIEIISGIKYTRYLSNFYYLGRNYNNIPEKYFIFYSSIYIALIDIFVKNNNLTDEEECIYTKKILTSSFVEYLIANNLHFSKQQINYIRTKKEFEILSKGAYVKDNEGKLIILYNEYEKLFGKYINNHVELNSLSYLNSLEEICLNLKSDIILPSIPYKNIFFKKSKNCYSLKIINFNGTRVFLNSSGKLYYRGWGKCNIYEVLFFGFKKIYIRNNKKYRPIMLKDIIQIGKSNSCFLSLIFEVINFTSKQYPLFKELIPLINGCLDNKFNIFPLDINELFDYHNWHEYFIKKYKKAYLLNINFNKIPPNISWIIIRGINYISISDRQIFISYLKNNFKYFRYQNIKDMMVEIITDFYLKKINFNEDNDEYNNQISDWVRLCIKSKIKISLRKTSIKKIQDEHDDMNINLFLKQHKKKDYFMIKEKSQFNQLRNILPKEFECISTYRRLISETLMQHHCVWTYENFIKKDVSAIYSFVVPETKNRHTIEFKRLKNGNYYINQIQKKYDRGFNEEIFKYIPSSILQHI